MELEPNKHHLIIEEVVLLCKVVLVLVGIDLVWLGGNLVQFAQGLLGCVRWKLFWFINCCLSARLTHNCINIITRVS
jgi:hypothetical protein